MGSKADPPASMYAVLQNHGERDGGWGPAALVTPGGPLPIVYSGKDKGMVEQLRQLAASLAVATNKETLFVRYGEREDLERFPGGGP